MDFVAKTSSNNIHIYLPFLPLVKKTFLKQWFRVDSISFCFHQRYTVEHDFNGHEVNGIHGTVGHGSEWLLGATHPKMTPPTIVQNFGILEEFWWRKQVFSSNRLRILRKSIWGVVKWEGQNGTWTPLTEIAAIWVVWDLNTNGFLLLSPQIHRKKYICQSHHKMSI